MGISKKLDEWQAAGLIDRELASRLREHEKKQSRPLLMYAVGTLGGLSIAIGLLSVVAANWDGISSGIKLSLALVLGAALAAGLFFAHEARRTWATEILVILYYGYTLAAFALLGQVYHSGTPPYQALLLWTVVTTPLVLVGQSYLLGAIWLAGLITSHSIAAVALFDSLDDHMGSRMVEEVIVATLFVSPFLYLLVSRIPWLTENRPHFSTVFNQAAWLVLLGAAFTSQFIWYDGIHNTEHFPYGVVFCNVVACVFSLFLRRLYPSLSRQAHLAIGVTMVLVCLSAALGLTLAHDNLALVGSISNILFLAGAAWACLSLGAYRWFHVATGLIAARLIVIYFEVFGSMMDTGLGLVLGGVLTLLLAWFWRRKSSRMVSLVTKNPEVSRG